MWSKKVESTRKDVERAFGMSKKRFRILKFPFSLRDVRDINFVTIACFTFHNMLFDYDEQFRDPVRDEMSSIIQANRANRIIFGQRQVIRDTMARDRETGAEPELECVPECDDGYALKRQKMAMHLHYEYVRRNLIW